MTKSSKSVIKWRQKSKQRILNSMGNKCQICNYNKCPDALALHHINPKEKDLSFGKIRANPTNWNLVVTELRKCILLCHNCHSEVHNGMTLLPDKYEKFDEEYADYKTKQKEMNYDICKCGNKKHVTYKFCSVQCSMKDKEKVDWYKIDLIKELKIKSKAQLARELNVSETTIRKRLDKWYETK